MSMTPARNACTLALLLGLLPVFGCEPAISHRTLTRIFNGVPEIPSQEALCRDFGATSGSREKVSAAAEAPKSGGSKHPPYTERHCDSCHASEGGISNNLVKPKDELCFICHKKMADGLFVHGPVISGDCLACHEPHESANTALLIKPRDKICENCHEERRVAAGMHGRLSQHGAACPDCHDPHAGSTKYFVK